MKQLVFYFITIVLWIFGLMLAFTEKSPWLLMGLAALHFVELITIGFYTGRKYGEGIGTCIIMCMLFGFVWWAPLRKTMSEDELTDADFVEDDKEPWREAF
jgi:hypothetical protein